MHSPESVRRNILSHVIVEVGFVLLWFGFVCYAFTTFISIGGEGKSTYGSLFTTPTKLNIHLFESREGEEKTKLADTKPQEKTPISDRNFYTISPAASEALSSLPIINIGKDEVSRKIGNSDKYETIIGINLAFSFVR